MNILAINLGSYSIKFLQSRVEKKRILPLDVREVPLQSLLLETHEEIKLIDLQLNLIVDFLEDTMFEGKIILNVPSELLTTRYLELPVLQRKKAEMMIPFQLDEDLPFPMAKAHITKSLEKVGQVTWAQVNIAELEPFEEFYNKLKKLNIVPAVLSSELSIIQTFIDSRKMSGSFCILDLGHETAHAFFVLNQKIVANHVSHIAGSIIDEVISQTYQIPIDEAVVYKHESCFFLTENQYEEVEEEQKEFALLMKKSFDPLIKDLKRWILGHRVKYGASLSRVYLIGGSSSIKNVDNFIAQSLGIEVEFLDTIAEIPDLEEMLDPQARSRHFLNSMVSISHSRKLFPPNFLTGAFASDYNQNIPLHSSAFLGVRVLILCLILGSFLLIERFIYLAPENKKVSSRLKKQLKAKDLEFSKRKQKSYLRSPEKLVKAIKKKNRFVSQEISTIQSATKIYALKTLTQLSELVKKDSDVRLSEFKSDGTDTSGVFQSKDSKKLVKVQKTLENSGLPNFSSSAKGENSFTFQFSEEK